MINNMRKLTKNRNGIFLLLTLSLACLLMITQCMPKNEVSQISDIVNRTDWSNDFSGANLDRITEFISNQEGLKEFFNLLESDDEYTIVNTANLIQLLVKTGRLHDPQKSRVISALNRVISGSDSQYKAKAIIALDNTANHFIFSYEEDRVLEESLTDKDVVLITEIVDSLIVALKDEDDKIKSFAAQSIHHFGLFASHAEPELIKLLESDDIDVRLNAAATIGHINPGTSIDVVPILLDGLSIMDRGSFRIVALKALVKIGDTSKEVVDTLIQFIETEDYHIQREAAVDALIELHPEPENIIPQLRMLLNSEDSSIRDAANRILLEYEDEVDLDEIY